MNGPPQFTQIFNTNGSQNGIYFQSTTPASGANARIASTFASG